MAQEIGCTTRHPLLDHIERMNTSTTKMGIVLGVMLIGIIGSDCYAQSPDPITLIQGVEMARLKIPPSRLHFHLVFRSQSRTTESDRIMEFDGDRRRSVGLTPQDLSLFYDGSQACLYDPSRKYASFRDIRDSTADALFDPRTIGLSPVLGWAASVSDHLPYKQGRVEMVGREQVRGIDTWHVRISIENPYKYQIDLWIGDTERFPVYRYDATYDTERQSVTSFYENKDYPWLPSKAESSFYNTNGTINLELTASITKAEANVAFSETNWTLAALNMPVGTPVMDRRTKLTVGYWNGTNATPFEVWQANQRALMVTELAKAKFRQDETAIASEKRVAELPWAIDLPKALEQAKAGNKIVLLDFTGSDWCVWCGKFDDDILSKPEFAGYATAKLVMVLVDFPLIKKQSDELNKRNADLQARFKVEGFPTFLALDSDGKEIGRQVGYLPGGPQAFIAKLDQFKKQ